jgi:probable addiction module antidote protein
MATLEVREYQTAEGKTPLAAWLEGLRDGATRARIVARLDRLKAGLLGDWKTVGGGVCELRIDRGPDIACTTGRKVRRSSCCYVVATRAHKSRISRQPMPTGKITKPASPSRPFKAAEHLRSEAEVAAYVEAMLEDGDPRAVPIALRTVVDAVGGMAALADKTGLSRETLYRTLSERGNPRLDTLAVILAAFGLRLTVQQAQKSRGRRSEARPALA